MATHETFVSCFGTAEVVPAQLLGQNLADRERDELDKFKKTSLEIYHNYLGDLSQWVGEVRVDEAKFIFHVAPSRASTGDRYANFLIRRLNWLNSIPGSSQEGGTPLEKLRVVEYVESILVQKGIGRYTPNSCLFALDYISKAFGFDPIKTQ